MLHSKLDFKLCLVSPSVSLSGSWVVRKQVPSWGKLETESSRSQRTRGPESSPAMWVTERFFIASLKKGCKMSGTQDAASQCSWQHKPGLRLKHFGAVWGKENFYRPSSKLESCRQFVLRTHVENVCFLVSFVCRCLCFLDQEPVLLSYRLWLSERACLRSAARQLFAVFSINIRWNEAKVYLWSWADE